MPRIPRKQTPDPRRKKHERVRPQDKRYWKYDWRKLRNTFIKNNPLCNHCGRLAQMVDHIQPVRLGGDFTDIDNLQSLCNHCHAKKSGAEAHLG